MSQYRIDRWGVLRKDGRAIGWTPADFIWARPMTARILAYPVLAILIVGLVKIAGESIGIW